jgi:hypothetical protein
MADLSTYQPFRMRGRIESSTSHIFSFAGAAADGFIIQPRISIYWLDYLNDDRVPFRSMDIACGRLRVSASNGLWRFAGSVV